MTALMVMVSAAAVLIIAGRFYSGFLARHVGEDPTRTTPAIAYSDGVDYIPTPTPIVFAHHFASIAGAGPIVGPVIAIVYGWVPALLWIVLGGVFIGAAHDYLATYMSTREGGKSIATVARRMLGKDAFIAITIFLIIMLALVCAAFLSLSAKALTSMLPFARLGLESGQTLFRVVEGKAVIGGIASTSVIIITAVAPVLGWLYLKKKTPVAICSILAIGICILSVVVGFYRPVAMPSELSILGFQMTGIHCWMLILSGYVLFAAGLPVWIFLQSRDFINVHILYFGMAGLVLTLLVGGFGAASHGEPLTSSALPAFNIDQGQQAVGAVWPGLFIIIACGATSGFHSLCGGGTTCKQLTNEPAARYVGYYGMLLESFLAVCVIAMLIMGTSRMDYIQDVHPQLLTAGARGNPVLGFAMAVGNAVSKAFSVPVAVGAVAGMVMLEGFLVTTLDTAIRLTRYLIEEIWRTFFGGFDVFADAQSQGAVETRGPARWLLILLSKYWFNSALAVGLTLTLAWGGAWGALWGIFATSNQLLAAMGLAIVSLWLLRQGKSFWFAIVPAIGMLITTATNLVLLLKDFTAKGQTTLLAADIVIMIITAYLLLAGVRAGLAHAKAAKTQQASQ